MANAAGFQHFCGPFVTILSSKNSQRYRIQSDNLPALWLLIQSLENRLHAMFDNNSSKNDSSSSSQNSPLEFSYSASLPLHEYFTEIETHFHKRNKLQLLMVSKQIDFNVIKINYFYIKVFNVLCVYYSNV